MAKNTDIRLCRADLTQSRVVYRTPIKFGGRVVSDAVVVDVTVDVETRDGRRGRGTGSMPMGNAWAWPSKRLSGEQTLASMLRFAQRTVERANQYREFGHPLDLTRALAAEHHALSRQVCDELGLTEPAPVLADLVAASPLEAAIHDAYGRVHQANSYNLLGSDFANYDLAHYLTADFAGEYADRYTLRQPKPRMPLYHLVGALDPLTDADVVQRINDGLPETLGEWIDFNGLTHLKIKLAGDDLDWDVNRVASVDQVAAQTQQRRGVTNWCYSLDFNEKCANVDYVLEFLRRLEPLAPAGLQRVQYIEQPTHRDLKANPGNTMHAAAKLKPVVIDESLIDLESLLLARELGYSGVALKACKGHSEALLMGAAAQKYGLFLCVQDLTCIGASFLHSASIAARLPGIAAIEGNGRQYCPAGNRGWDERYVGMFRVTDGTMATSELNGVGLGFQ